MAKKTISWPLAPAPESKDHFTLKQEYELFIGGKWTAPKSGNYFDTINTANPAHYLTSPTPQPDASLYPLRFPLSVASRRSPSAGSCSHLGGLHGYERQ